jgi:lipoprotein-releasing system permease protein
MPWYLYFALKQVCPTRGRVSFITAVSVGGVTLGVMLLVVVLSLMNGFAEEIRHRIVDTSGDIRIVGAGTIAQPGPILDRVRALPEVAAAAPYVRGLMLLQAADRTALPGLRGIDPAQEAAVIPLGKFLVAGRLEDLDDEAVVLGSGLAERLDVRVGEELDLIPPQALQPGHTTAIKLGRSLRVAGIFHTDWGQLDDNSAICTARLLQDLYELGTGVHGITVRLRAGVDVDAVTAGLNRWLPPEIRAVSWQDSNRDFLYVVQLEKNVMFFLLFFIEIVAAFAIAGSLLIVVARRAREIGLLAALGARRPEIAAIFCLQGLMIGSAGTLLGLAGAGLALHYRHGLLHLLARVTQHEAALERFQRFSDLPMGYAAQDIVLVVGATLVISTLAGLLPAWRAARLRPAVALRDT